MRILWPREMTPKQLEQHHADLRRRAKNRREAQKRMANNAHEIDLRDAEARGVEVQETASAPTRQSVALGAKMKVESVATIERAIANLKQKRESIEARAEEIAGRRKVLGYLALVSDDKAASAELAKLNVEHSAVAGAISGLDDALSEGQKRLALARAAEATRADQREARELAEQLEIFEAAGKEIDAALETLVDAPRRMQDALLKMHALGAPRPDHRQFSTLSKEAVITALRRTPWQNEFPPQPVSQRRRFSDLVSSWSSGIRSRITPRLGATEKAA
jgi:hypothetical protein